MPRAIRRCEHASVLKSAPTRGGDGIIRRAPNETNPSRLHRIAAFERANGMMVVQLCRPNRPDRGYERGPMMAVLLSRPLTSPSDDKRWRVVDVAMRRHGYAPSALIEALHAVQQSFGYLDGPSCDTCRAAWVCRSRGSSAWRPSTTSSV